MLGTYHRLHVRISASNVDVIRAARKRIAKAHRTGLAMRHARKEFYRLMLAHHADAQHLAHAFRL